MSKLGQAHIIQGNALALPLPNASVDLICTSPPYFGLRSYQDGGVHYDGQIGSEPTPAEFLDALLAATREMVRVLKPSGSIFVNLGDKYAADGPSGPRNLPPPAHGTAGKGNAIVWANPPKPVKHGMRSKSLMGIPWRYAIRCIDQLGLILRAEIIWHKPNGLPESVTDRVRRSHEQWFHFVKQPRYFAAVDEIRGAYSPNTAWKDPDRYDASYGNGTAGRHGTGGSGLRTAVNPLGKLPGSVWTVPTQPLTVPPELGIDHFACVDVETEILTSTGWRRWDEVKAGDIAAGYDLNTNRAKWTEVEAVHSYDYDGEMVAVESRDLSMRLTPNHRVIAQRMNSRTKQRGPTEVIDADQLDRYHFIPRSAEWTYALDNGTKSPGSGWASILGWIAAEGWYQGRCVYLSQSASANPDKVKQIDALLPDATWRRERERFRRGKPTLDVEWRLSDEDATAVQAAMPTKLLPNSLVNATFSARWAALFAFIAGDGHTRVDDGRIAIFQKNRHNLDVLQAIAVTLGYKTSLQFGGVRWVLYLTYGGRSTTLRGTNGVGSKVTREHYTGTVWCPTTGTGTFIARRRGIPFITGNSYPMEWPRRIIQGWTPNGVCTECGQGRQPVTEVSLDARSIATGKQKARALGRETPGGQGGWDSAGYPIGKQTATITGYMCGCADATAPITPSVILDPFGGTGTTALVAKALGRTGISIDLSSDYCRLATWRCNDPRELAAALEIEKPEPVNPGQLDLFDGLDTA